jgi:hypothetical protein
MDVLKKFWQKFDAQKVTQRVVELIAPISAETLQLIGVILIHASIIPTLLALLTGLSDRTPPIDMVLLLWAGLTALFIQAAVVNNRLILFTISVGFIVQSAIMALVFFR